MSFVIVIPGYLYGGITVFLEEAYQRQIFYGCLHPVYIFAFGDVLVALPCT